MGNYSNRANKILNNAYAYSVIAKIISVITGFLYSILYSRYLGSELRGTASVILNNSDIIMLFLCLGVYQAYPFFKKRSDHSIYMEYIDFIFGMFFTYCSVCLLLAVLFRPGANACVILFLIPFMFAVKELNYVVLIENPRLRNTTAIRLDFFDIVFILCLMFFTTANYFWCIILLLVKHVVAFLIAVSNLKISLSSIRPRLKGVWPYIRFGFVPMLTVVMMEINYKADIIMLDYFNIAKADIGVYSLGVSLAQKVWMIPDALKDILLSKLAGGKDKNEVCKVTRISVFITGIFLLIMFLAGRPVIWLLYGDEYAGAYFMILILSLGILGMVFYKMVYSYNVINGNKNTNFALLGSAAFINIILNVFLIPSYGIIGAAFASTVSYLMCGIGFLFYFVHNTKSAMKDMVLLRQSDVQAIVSSLNSHGRKKN